MNKMIKRVLTFFKFLVTTFYIFYVVSVFGALYAILTCRRHLAPQIWSQWTVKSLRVSFSYVKGSNDLSKKNRTMFLINHRTQADFFIHDVVTGCSANFLARWMVAVVFPFTWIISTLCTGSVWFFRRGGVDLGKFYQWIDHNFSLATHRQNIVVYPEGHRMSKAEKPGFLKKGMLEYAFLRKLDVQIIMTFGVEDVFNEKTLTVSWGPTVITSYVDKPILTTDFDDFKSFYDHIVQRFAECFDIAYQASLEAKEQKKIK